MEQIQKVVEVVKDDPENSAGLVVTAVDVSADHQRRSHRAHSIRRSYSSVKVHREESSSRNIGDIAALSSQDDTPTGSLVEHRLVQVVTVCTCYSMHSERETNRDDQGDLLHAREL